MNKKQFFKNKQFGLRYTLSILSFFLSLHLSVGVSPSPLPLSSDSRLFSPTLCRDLIEGNHSDKKPPQSCGCTCLCSCPRMCAHLFHPTLPPPPIKIPCCSLDPCLALYLPKRAFCVAQKRATVSGREWEEALVIGAGGGSASVVSDPWEHLLNIRRAGVLPKMLHFSLLSLALLAPITTTLTNLKSNPPQWPVFELSVDFFALTLSKFRIIKAFPHSHSCITY